ncbi:MAG: methyltransferase domain-containing protein [Silvanigrellales bacterium]|nr:methyltransferase domain-containing protein [Silvanigrellales bacterium]
MRPAAPATPETFVDVYARALEKHLFPTGVDAARIGSVARGVKSLWARFNTKRSALDREYMAESLDLEAYLASFCLPNVERVRAVLQRFATPEKIVAESPRTSPAQRPGVVRILDFGSGPLSASAGALAALDASGLLPAHVEIVAVELSSRCVEVGATLLRTALPTSTELIVKRASTLDAVPQDTYDFVLAANVFNEVPVASRGRFLARLAQLCAPGGRLLLLEPGQDTHSRALALLRDRFLESGTAAGFALVAPCLHRKACPLGPERDRKDWCWFRHNWRRPAFLVTLDAKSGLEHDELAYSFVLFQKHEKDASVKEILVSPAAARVVSDPIPMPSTPEGLQKLRGHLARNAATHLPPAKASSVLADTATKKMLLCTSEGRLEGLYSPKQAERKSRGSVVDLDKFQLRAKEREAHRIVRDDDDDPEVEVVAAPKLKMGFAKTKTKKTKSGAKRSPRGPS